MPVVSLDELKKAVKALEPEIVVTDEGLARKVVFWNTLRTLANVLVIVVLAIGIAWWANPLRIPELGMKTLILWDSVTIAGDGWMETREGPDPQSNRLRVVHPTHGQS